MILITVTVCVNHTRETHLISQVFDSTAQRILWVLNNNQYFSGIVVQCSKSSHHPQGDRNKANSECDNILSSCLWRSSAELPKDEEPRCKPSASNCGSFLGWVHTFARHSRLMLWAGQGFKTSSFSGTAHRAPFPTLGTTYLLQPARAKPAICVEKCQQLQNKVTERKLDEIE